MMKSRGTVTEKLADVFQVLQLARKTGQLTVERDSQGNALEQGTITFLNGQITNASTGPYRGSAALEVLKTWRTCYFTFQPSPTTGALSPTVTPAYVSTPAQNEWLRGPQYTPRPIYDAPYRLRQVDEVLPYFNNMGLSRVHRQLFLLIDGHRTAQELMRLMGRNPLEVDSLLFDLERLGLIRK